MRRNYLLFFCLLFLTFGSVSAQLHAFFTASDSLGCPPLVVQFTNQTTGANGAATYAWDLGNTDHSNLANPSAVYTNPGQTYVVKLVVTDGASVDSFSMVIRTYQPPIDSFTSSAPSGCANPCHLDNFHNFSIPGNAPILYYAWDFGDGSLADSAVNPSHCYTDTGTFTVILVARDSNGCETSISRPAYEHVGVAPVVTVTANPSPAQTCGPSLTVQFTGTATSPNMPITTQWFFGNLQTSSQLTNPPAQTYTTGIYDAILVVTDALGCRDTAGVPVLVTDVQAAFGATTINACAGFAVQFNDSSNFATGWSWTFGDGSTSTLQNPQHIYAAAGNYSVTLTATYGPCSSTVTRNSYIHVTAPIIFNFNGTPNSSCSPPLIVGFNNNAAGAAGFLWTFGDGDSSTQSAPTHIYSAAGSYTVSLSVANSSGCVNTVTDSNYIIVGNPSATIAVDSFHGCAPVPFSFSTTSTSGGTIASYQWIFGDGSTSGLANVNHTYTTPGDYLPMLIVTTTAGCKDTVYAADSIKVGTLLVPNFDAAPLMQCVDKTIHFTNETVDSGPTTQYLWQFGDGQTSTQSDPTHAYTDTGQYSVTLNVINQGCMSDTTRLKYILIIVPKAEFLYSFACSSPNDVTFKDTSAGAQTWLWEFGDGDTSHAQNPPTHHYDTAGHYTVVLIVSNSSTGCVDSMKQTLAFGAPHVAFSATPRVGCLNLGVQFTDSSNLAVNQLWYFGDGSGGSFDPNPNHTYTDTGKYAVTLIVNPGSQCADTLIVPDYITVYGIVPHAIAAPPVGCSPLTVAFTDSSTSYMGTITSWDWHFGVGNDSSISKSPVFTYNAGGNYTAVLKVTDSHGCVDSMDVPIAAKNVVAFFTSDTIVCPGEQAHFTNLSQNAGAYLWEFGDGTTSVDTNPEHAYTTSAYYTVTLIAINTTYACRDTFVGPVPVHVDTPALNFSPSSTFSQCPPFPVQFTNLSNRTDLKWMWYFGDGDTSTAMNPFHIYVYPGYYSVTLVGTDSFGCSGSKTYTNLIQIKGPIGNFQTAPSAGCVPLVVNFTGTTSATQSSIFVPGPGAEYTNQIDVTYTYTQPGQYQPIYTLTDSFGCTVPYILPYVVIGSYPYQNLPPDTLICKGNYAQLSLPPGDSLQIAEHYIWTSNLPQTFLSCDTCPNPVCMSTDTITYYVSSTSIFASNNDTAFCTAKDTITVNVNALPEIFPGIDFRICPNDTLQLHAGPHVTEAVWTPDLYISDTSSVSPKVWPPDTTIYRVTGTNAAGCSISRIVRVWPISKVEAQIAVSDTTVCEGSQVPIDVVVLQASFLDTSFLWSPDKYLNSPVVQDATANLPPGNFNYQIIVSSRGCISDTATMHVVVSSLPDLEAGISQTVAYGTVVQLYAASHQNVNYTWSPSVDSLSCLDCRRPFVTVDESQTVFVTAQNEDGCKVTDSVVLRVVACDTKMIFVPNTFTPNGDGLNDVLYVRGAGLRELEYFRVFDRWGNIVFQTENLSEGWDGRIGGRQADIATYVYELRGVCSSGSVVDMSGNVTLIR